MLIFLYYILFHNIFKRRKQEFIIYIINGKNKSFILLEGLLYGIFTIVGTNIIFSIWCVINNANVTYNLMCHLIINLLLSLIIILVIFINYVLIAQKELKDILNEVEKDD